MTNIGFPPSGDLADWRQAFYYKPTRSYMKIYAPDAKTAMRGRSDAANYVYLGFTGHGAVWTKCGFCGLSFLEGRACPHCKDKG